MENIKFESYSDEYIYKLIYLCFKYYDSYLENEYFEDESDSFIKENNSSSETKLHIKYIIDFISKYYNSEESVLVELLKNISNINFNIEFNETIIELFIKLRDNNIDNIEVFMLANINKKIKSRVSDFSYNFNSIVG